MKKVLYIGHSYHNKTKSTQFLKDMLASQYDVDFFSYDPSVEKLPFNQLKKIKYDIVVLFQVMPSLRLLKKYLDYEHGIFFPMFDAVPQLDDPRWYEYREFRIINFSRTVHDELRALGFDSHYFQYFPKPADNFEFGDEKSLFFWQRRQEEIDIRTIEKTIDTDELTHIHIHKATDPNSAFAEPGKKLLPKCSFSNWFDNKEELVACMQRSALYFAPRKFEGIGMSFLEAMAMGRCVIAPDHPTMNEYIVHRETGFLYDFYNLQRIELQDISRIQKNTYEYIKQGYQEWEKKKFEILTLLEPPLVQTVQWEKFYKPLTIAGLKIPFVTVLNFSHKKKYRLFNCITVFKTVQKKQTINFYLFDFIFLFSIKKEI